FENLFGTCTWSNLNIHDNYSRQAYIDNGSNGVTSGSLTLNITSSTFGRTSAPLVSSQQGILMVLRNITATAFDITTSTIVKSGNGNGIQINVQDSSTLGTAGTHSSVHAMTSMSENAAHVYVNTNNSAVSYIDVLNNLTM